MYAFTQDVPIDLTFYQRITDALGPQPAKGSIVHLAIQRPEGGLRYIDVWESEEDCDRFTEERLHPALYPLLSEIFGDRLPPEPERVRLDVAHVWGPGIDLRLPPTPA